MPFTGGPHRRAGSPSSGSSTDQPQTKRTNHGGAGEAQPQQPRQDRRAGNVKTYAVKASEIERQLVGRRCDRPDPRPAGDAHRHPAGGQAQADLLAAPRHRGPRGGPQRREDQVTGDKLRQKSYFRHSNYPGGLREESLGTLLERKPELVIERAVKGMLPQNRLGRAMFKKLKVYSGRGASAPGPAAHSRRAVRRGRTNVSTNYVYGTGRRKTAVARVRLLPGDGSIVVNGKPSAEYFGGATPEGALLAAVPGDRDRGPLLGQRPRRRRRRLGPGRRDPPRHRPRAAAALTRTRAPRCARPAC